MRTLYSLLTLVFITLMFSCTKHNLKKDKVAENVIIHQMVKRGEEFKLSLKQYIQKKQKTLIATQASDFIKSEIVKGETCSDYTYHFISSLQPKVASSNSEKVVIKLYNENSDGDCNKRESFVTIHFTLQ